MANDFTGGDPHQMRDVANFMDVIEIVGDLARALPDTLNDGMAEGSEFSTMDHAKTDDAQKFLTAAKQGIAWYESTLNKCADIYEGGIGMSKAQFDSVLNRPQDANLPEHDQGFPQPRKN